MSSAPKTNYTALLGAAPQIGDDCLEVNRAFALCKREHEHPKKCLGEGEKVTACVLKVLRFAEENCADNFKAYQSCLLRKDLRLDECRETEKAFAECMEKR